MADDLTWERDEAERARDNWREAANEAARNAAALLVHAEGAEREREAETRRADDNGRDLKEAEATIQRYGEALGQISTYNADELREWKEENAADMVDIARAALSHTQEENDG